MTWAIIAGVLLVLLAGFYGLARSQGSAHQKLERHKINEKIRKKLAKVPRPSLRDTIDRLRRGEF